MAQICSSSRERTSPARSSSVLLLRAKSLPPVMHFWSHEHVRSTVVVQRKKTSRHCLNPLNTLRVLSVGRAQGAGVSETSAIRRPRLLWKRGTFGGTSRVHSGTFGYIRVYSGTFRRNYCAFPKGFMRLGGSFGATTYPYQLLLLENLPPAHYFLYTFTRSA